MDTVRNILEIKGYHLWTISPDATVFEALRRMAEKDIGSLVVMEGDRLAGIMTERDYARKVILQGLSSKDSKVREIMTEKVVTVHPMQTVNECMTLMVERKFSHIPVVEDQEVIGLVSIGDVLRNIIYRQKETIKTMEDKLLGKTIVD